MSWVETIDRLFPNALSFSILLERSIKILGDRGFNADNTLFANATCRDEVNKAAVDTFAGHWGENFDLAGLGGYPSAGLTGFAAYTHHAPDNGRLLILYGSHLGISRTGEPGKVLRPGMARESGSCGALLGFLGKLERDPSHIPVADPLDREQHALEQALVPTADMVLAAPFPLLALTERAFEAVDTRLNEIIDRSEFPGPIAILGGIILNTPEGEDDCFALRHAEILNVDGEIGRSEDLLAAYEA